MEEDIIGFTRTFRPVRKPATKYQRSRIVYPVAEAPKSKAIAKLPEEQNRALAPFSSYLQNLFGDLLRDTEANSGVIEMMGRWTEFENPAAAMLAGIYMNPVSFEQVDQGLDKMWNEARPVDDFPGEIVVGGGLHAAIYCAVRARMGFERPLVLEQRARVGGIFAVSDGPSFYLNSRNRPGPLSIPGEQYGLNVLPGAILQPADLSGDEYQTNEALAYVTRITLAMFADVIPQVQVQGWERADENIYRVTLGDDSVINTERIVFATGLGEPRRTVNFQNDRILSFDDLMRRMSRQHPLQGMQRVAVVGGGDGGKTAIEALCGQGPSKKGVMSLDYPEQIDWYGAPWSFCLDCTQLARVRYKRLSSLLPDGNNPGRPYRVNPLPTSNAFSAGYETVFVGQTPYDYVIDATGYENNREAGTIAVVDEVRTGRQFGEQVFLIGPGSELEVSPAEQEVLRAVDENKTSIFRYANRTAALAASLD